MTFAFLPGTFGCVKRLATFRRKIEGRNRFGFEPAATEICKGERFSAWRRCRQAAIGLREFL